MIAAITIFFLSKVIGKAEKNESSNRLAEFIAHSTYLFIIVLAIAQDIALLKFLNRIL
jgi:hypothetical protein